MSNNKLEVSREADLKKVRELVAKGELEEAIADLDPNDVPGTLDRVPMELVRLTAAIHTLKDLSDVLPYLPQEQVDLFRKLVAASKKHRAHAFVESLVRAMESDQGIRARVGVESFLTSAWPITETEARAFNTITSLSVTPQIMLRSRRVYADVAFEQRGDLLWRCKLEIDELLVIGSALLGHASDILDRLCGDERIGVRLQHVKCGTALHGAEEAVRKARRHLGVLTKRMAAAKKESESHSSRSKTAKSPKKRSSVKKAEKATKTDKARKTYKARKTPGGKKDAVQ